MQAPLSSTASGQQLRTGPPLGLPPSTHALRPVGDGEGARGLPETSGGRRMRAWSPTGISSYPLSNSSVAEGAGLAHDAGNLLGALRLYCDLLARPGVLRDEHRHYADELQLLSRRSGALVDRLLNPAKTARRLGGGDTADVPTVSVPAVIEQCRGLLNTIARRAVEVVYGAGAETPVPISREAIERILVNLTKNAAEASAEDGSITLRVSRLRAEAGGKHRDRIHSRIVLSIEDHGRGMSVAAVKVLLAGNGTSSSLQAPAGAGQEQPQRLHGLGLVSRRGMGRTPGRGLGFRVVRELVEASGGELRLRSESGCGTTVEIAWFVAGEAVNREKTRAGFTEEDGERQAVPADGGTVGKHGRVSC